MVELLPTPLRIPAVEVIADVADQSGAYHQQVSPGLRPRGRIHPQHGHQGIDQQQRNDRDGQDTADKGGIQAVDGVPHSFRLPCAERLGDDHRAAGGNAGEQGGEQEDHRESHAYGGQSRVADIVTYHPAIYHIVKLLQKVPASSGKINRTIWRRALPSVMLRIPLSLLTIHLIVI